MNMENMEGTTERKNRRRAREIGRMVAKKKDRYIEREKHATYDWSTASRSATMVESLPRGTRTEYKEK